jgi:hypothetical protein
LAGSKVNNVNRCAVGLVSTAATNVAPVVAAVARLRSHLHSGPITLPPDKVDVASDVIPVITWAGADDLCFATRPGFAVGVP